MPDELRVNVLFPPVNARSAVMSRLRWKVDVRDADNVVQEGTFNEGEVFDADRPNFWIRHLPSPCTLTVIHQDRDRALNYNEGLQRTIEVSDTVPPAQRTGTLNFGVAEEDGTDPETGELEEFDIVDGVKVPKKPVDEELDADDLVDSE
jgi:hypothetical protein